MGIKEFIWKNLQPKITVLGVVLGTILGIILRFSRNETWSKREVMYVGFIGELFLRSLKALKIPVIFSSVTSTIGDLDISLSKRIAFRAIFFYISTNMLAAILGIILVMNIQPGGTEYIDENRNSRYTPDILMDIPRNLLPSNLVQAAFETYKTEIIQPNKTLLKTQLLLEKYNLTNGEIPSHEWNIDSSYDSKINILGLLFFSVVLGIALNKLKERGKPLLNLFHSLNDSSLVITRWLIYISPIPIIFLLASLIIREEDVFEMIRHVGMYIITVLLGLGIHGLLILPGLYYCVVRKSPYIFMINMKQALITSFVTASSYGTLPVTMNCLENLNGIDPHIIKFVLQIGYSFNFNGTGLYEAVAAIFIAQGRGLILSYGKIITISITSTMASIGAAVKPQAGLITMVTVLDIVGIPIKYMAIIISVDWLLDRFRTAMDVLVDSYGVAIVYELSKNNLEKLNDFTGKFDQVKLSPKWIELEKTNFI